MNTKLLRIMMVMALPVTLAGCWNANRSYNELMAQGQQRNVPLMIYNTSWNDASRTDMGTGYLTVGLVNTGSTQIASVTLYVASCPLQANAPNTHEVTLSGPFLSGKAYVTQYAVPSSARQIGHGPIGWAVRPLVIQAIGVTDASGRQTTYRDNVAQMLTPNISNYCQVVPQNG